MNHDEVRRELDGQPWWFACQHPERPADEYVVWVWDCDPCYLHLAAAARITPDQHADRPLRIEDKRSPRVASTFAEAFTLGSEWRQSRGLSVIGS